MNIQELINKYPNNYELGEAVRKLFENESNFVHIDGSICKFGSTRSSWFIRYTDRVIHNIKDDFIEGTPIFAKLEDTTRKKSEDYEILSIKYGNEVIKSNEYGIDKIIEGSVRFEGDGKWTIYSVKRLSDGVVFTIGDYVKFPTIRGNITEITEHYIAIHDVTTRIANVTHATCKAKKLFTTFDGVDINEGEEYWYIVESNPFIDKNIPLKGIARDANPHTPEIQKHLGSKCFSTKEKAKDYILQNNVKYTNTNPSPFTITFDDIDKCSDGLTKCVRVQKFLGRLKGLELDNVEKKQDYEILSFSDNGRIYTINGRGTYDWGMFKNRTLKFFKDNKIPVHAIQRLSDGYIFAVGSVAGFPGIGKVEITKILSNGHVCYGDICFPIRYTEHA